MSVRLDLFKFRHSGKVFYIKAYQPIRLEELARVRAELIQARPKHVDRVATRLGRLELLPALNIQQELRAFVLVKATRSAEEAVGGGNDL